MENNRNSRPLLLRMSTQPEQETKPPNLLTRLSTPPLRKRKGELLSESSERWISSGRESIPDSKRPRVSPTSWENGQERQIRRKEKRLTLTSPKSTPSLLSRMRTDPQREKPLPLLERLTDPISAPLENGSETRLRTSWIRSLEENPREMTMSPEFHGNEQEKTRCLGLAPPSAQREEPAASRLVELSSSSAKTYQELRPSCELPATSLKASLQPNGTEFFEANPSTSIKSSHQCTLSNLMRRERAAWEELKLFSPWQNRSDKSGLDQNGRQPLDECQKRSLSFSPTEGRNYTTTQNTSKVFSPPKTPARI